jgi:hypothetical protein
VLDVDLIDDVELVSDEDAISTDRAERYFSTALI